MAHKFELAGVNRGKTINLGGFAFVEGVYTFASEDLTGIEGLAVYLERSYYAFPAGSPALEEAQARYDREQKTGVAENVETQTADELNPGEVPSQTVKDAVDALNPDDDTHWTGAGLPSTDAVSDLAGEKVSRAQIEAVAAGYTRAAAKAAAGI